MSPTLCSPKLCDPSLDDAFRIVAQIRRIVRAIHLHSQELSRSAGLTVAQLVLLQAVAAAPDGQATATYLRQDVGVNAATMSGLVDRLVRRDLLARQRSEIDRRVVLLTLTAAGRQALAESPSPLQGRVLARLRDLPPLERAEILASLERVVGLMQADDLGAGPILVPGPDSASS